jgi:hypothetical protein
MKGKPQGGRAPRGEADHTTSKSPPRTLVKVFQTSRDQWKAKCRGAKAALKTLKKQLHGRAERPQRWKSRVKAGEEELTRLRVEQRALTEVGTAGEKKER